MFISIRLLNSPGTADIQLEVSSSDQIQEIKSRLVNQTNIPINQQKLLFKGKPLHDGSLVDHDIINGSKLHLIVTAPQPMKGLVNSALGQELRLLAAKWIDNPNQREAFVNAFLVEMKNAVDQLSLDDIEKFCANQFDQTV